MIDKAKPEALRIADEFKLCGDFDSIPSIIDIEKAEAELRRQHTRIAELEAEIAAVGAGGVQALSAAPVGWKFVPEDATDAMVRATDAVNFANGDTDATMHDVWHALLAASPTPPAEQQATTGAATPKAGATTEAALGAEPGAVYAELPDELVRKDRGKLIPRWRSIDLMMDFADRTNALRMQAEAKEGAEYAALICESRSRSLSYDGNHVAANEAKKCAGMIRAKSALPEEDDPMHPRYVAGYKAGHAAGRRRAEQAAPKAAPGEQRGDLLPCPCCGGEAKEHDRFNSNTVRCLSCGLRISQSEMGYGDAKKRWNLRSQAAPQQEAQEPVAWRYKFKEDLQWQYTTNKNHAHRLAVVEPLYTAPQPAPAPLSDDVVKDAARYRWLRGRLPGGAYRIAGVIYSEGGAGVDAAIDAAMDSRPQ